VKKKKEEEKEKREKKEEEEDALYNTVFQSVVPMKLHV